MQLPYKTALITGATSGIGEAFARKLPSSTHLILTGRNSSKLRELQEELQTETRKVDIIQADLAQSEGIEDLLMSVQSHSVDLFINNAGLGQYGAHADHTLQAEMHMIKVNVSAVTHLSHALCPTMARHNGPAAMIVVASVAAFMPLPYFATYAATKTYDLHLAESLAEEYKGSGLHIMALCPGPTRTNFGERSGMSGDSPEASYMDVNDVVEECLKGLERKKRVVVPGWQNKVLAQLPRFMPRRLGNIIAGIVVQRTRPSA